VALDRVGQPLSEKRTRTPQGHWLRNLDAPRSRALFWRNIIRVVRAIGLIHAQGLVHGAVGEANVMTDGGELPDFQLAGFEWSLALSDAKAGEGTHARVSPDAAVLRPPSYSFAEDWRCLGLMIGGCLERPASPAGRVLGPNGGLKAEANLSPGERRLLKRLLTPSRGDQLEAHAIVQAIEDVLVGLGRTAQTKAGSLVLAVDGKARLGDCVFDATDGLIAVDEHARQLDWLRAELDAGAALLVPPRFNPQRSGLRLVTAHAVCDLSATVRDGVAAWDVAICTRVRRRRDSLPYFEQEHEISQTVRLARGPRDAERERQRLGPDALDWSAFAVDVAPERDEHVDQVVDALFVAELTEAVVKASEAYPVEILARDRESGRPVVALRAQPKSDRDKVARKLKLTDGETALHRLFEDEARDPEIKWRLTRSAAMRASRTFDVGASFINRTEIKGRPAYRFELDEELPDDARLLFLRPQSDSGSERAISRRLSLLKLIGSRPDLADMLTDPWRMRRNSGETLSAADLASSAFKDLDEPKQQALVAAFEVAPTYLVVGPPGVGKTRLATEVVTRKFGAERKSRILVSAQGHDALNHVMAKCQEALGLADLSDVLIVRSATPENRTSEPEELQLRALDLLERLDASQGLAQLQAQIRDRVRELRGEVGAHLDAQASLAAKDRRGLGALGRLLLEAADVVVSTLNSADIEDLVEAREQFDWVLVEEAARATGPELVGALMLSGRRLLIGDHNQLPAYDADRMLEILGDHSLVGLALKQAQDWLAPMLEDDDEARLRDLVEGDPARLRATAERAVRLFAPFQTLVEEDEQNGRTRTGHRRISAMLTEQRRMDPAIADLVSTTFYKGELKTSASRYRALKDPPPLTHLTPMSSSPIVVVDFPHVSAPVAGEPVAREDTRRRRNREEIESVVDVMRHVRAAEGQAPTLAVLSPYRHQVDALAARIDLEMGKDLAHLAQFRPVRPNGAFVGTVDSFQGSEADLVILSLVRNNPRAGLGAVGFLRDRRRMNVALSRAKTQLVIVGSLRFLQEAVRGVNPDGGHHELDFLTTMVRVIDRLAGVPRDGLPLARKLAPSVLRAKR
jgi:hypothetical protein